MLIASTSVEVYALLAGEHCSPLQNDMKGAACNIPYIQMPMFVV